MISDWSKASLQSMQEAARRDDVLDKMVPSDLRVLLMRYAEALAVIHSAKALLCHWDERDGPEKRGSYEGVEYWSPAGRMVDTDYIAGLRAALSNSERTDG